MRKPRAYLFELIAGCCLNVREMAYRLGRAQEKAKGRGAPHPRAVTLRRKICTDRTKKQ